MNYDDIKEMKLETGIPVKDLIVLAAQNDPFYAGTAGDWEKGRWFAEIWNRAGFTSGVHLRRVHYWAVSQQNPILLPKPITWNGRRESTAVYINVHACWRYLCQAAKLARYLGLVEIADIADNKNPDPHEYANHDSEVFYEIDVPDLDNWKTKVFGFPLSKNQPYLIEIWCEKSTMNDVLLPICKKYAANLVTFEGEVSITACYDLVKRVEKADRPARIFYISDFDPAGMSMPVAMSRKVEYIIQQEHPYAEVKINPLVLTIEQVKQYRLPRTPIKDSEKRATHFENTWGSGAVELDALEALYPGVLANIVEEKLYEYYSESAHNALIGARKELLALVNEKTTAVIGKYMNDLDAFRQMVEELETIHIDVYDYELDPAEPHVEEYDDDWLFDTNREYLNQVWHYKDFQGK